MNKNQQYNFYKELVDTYKSPLELKAFIKANPDKGLKVFDKFFKNIESAETSLKDIYKVYDNGIQAITNLSFDIKSRQFICLLGPSGCGKSTLLRMIAGLEVISGGILKMGDKIANSLQPAKRGLSMVFQNYALYPYMNVKKNITFGLKISARNNDVIKNLKLIIKSFKNENYEKIEKLKLELAEMKHPKRFEIYTTKEKIRTFSVKLEMKAEVAALKSKIAKWKEKEKALVAKNQTQIKQLEAKITHLKKDGAISKNSAEHKKIEDLILAKKMLRVLAKQTIDIRAEHVCKVTGIDQYMSRKPSELSGGQRQRVALARTISKNKGLFLFDEPLSNLDAKLRSGMRELIRTLHDNMGATSIYVTHDQIEAMTMADKVIVMRDGFAQQADTPLNLFNNPANTFVAKFIGTPEMNLVKGTYSEGKILIKNQKLSIAANRIVGKLSSKSTKNNVIVGIRPHHIITDISITQEQKANIVQGRILFRQLLGNEYLYTISNENIGTFEAMAPSTMPYEIGDEIKCYFNPNRIILFDEKTENNITTKMNDETTAMMKNWVINQHERAKNQQILKHQNEKKTLTKKLVLKISDIRKNQKDKKDSNGINST